MQQDPAQSRKPCSSEGHLSGQKLLWDWELRDEKQLQPSSRWKQFAFLQSICFIKWFFSGVCANKGITRVKSNELQGCAPVCLAIPKAVQRSCGPDFTVSKATSDTLPTPAAGTWWAGGSCSPPAPSSVPAHRGEGSHSPLPWQVRDPQMDHPVSSACHKQVVLLIERKCF